MRRLLPASIPVCLYCVGFAYFFYLPDEFAAFSKSLLAFTFFSSNFFFLSTSGYFAAPVETMPLLHTWSLSIEEQYYLVFPALLLVMLKFPQRIVVLTLAAIFSASLAFAVWLGASASPEVSYLHSGGRFYELMAGSLLALLPQCRLNGTASIAGRWLGVILVMTSIFLLDESLPFPSFYALPPVAGSVLIIAAQPTPGDYVFRFLASNPITYIGRISYSLYLWHWPAIVTATYLLDTPSPLALGGALAAAALLSIASYHFVETPVRRRRLNKTAANIFAMLGLSIAANGAISAASIATVGLPQRFEPDMLAAMTKSKIVGGIGCSRTVVFSGLSGCMYGKPARLTDIEIIIWGDSLASGHRELYRQLGDNGHPVLMFSTPGCAPLTGVWKQRDVKKTCVTKNERVVKFITSTKAKVLIVGAWNDFATNFKNSNKLVSENLVPKNQAQLDSLFGKALDATFVQLRNNKVTVVGQQPRYLSPVPKYVFKRRLMGLPLENLVDFDAYKKTTQKVERSVSRTPHVEFLNLSNLFCPQPDNHCIYQEGGTPIYHDSVHLNATGAKLVAPVLRAAIAVE